MSDRSWWRTFRWQDASTVAGDIVLCIVVIILFVVAFMASGM